MRFVLVHSPLVGPATWRWVAEALTAAGHDAVVPDLREAAMSGEPEAVIGAALAASPRDSDVVVGHSGAGVLLPPIAARLEWPAPRIVFVDAGIPPCEGQATVGADFVDRLRAMAVGGRLPRWSTWWGEGAMDVLVPVERRRAEVEREMPEVPLAFCESPIALPAGWCDAAGAFLLLSEAYRQDADRASSFGWPVVERLGNHLDVVNEPDAVAHDIIELGG